jgi:hypothetical protein
VRSAPTWAILLKSEKIEGKFESGENVKKDGKATFGGKLVALRWHFARAIPTFVGNNL